ncbi:hypothetical protein RQP46_009348 [Phenoliferia psychrophenolica]
MSIRGGASVAQLQSELHRVPVLWSLYRPLLRLAPSHELAQHIQRAFRRTLPLRNLLKIQHKLIEGYSMLDDFDRIHAGDSILADKYATLSSHLARTRPAPTPPARRPPKPPVLTSGILFSTPYNPPLPRLKPQPEHISMLIFARRKAIQRRWDRFAVAQERAADAREENAFEARLGVQEGPWGLDWQELISESKKSFDMEAKRNAVSPR